MTSARAGMAKGPWSKGTLVGTIVAIAAAAGLATLASGASPRAGVEPFPVVAAVERQPLLAATTRLAAALEQAGAPLPAGLVAGL
ncbi:MAG: hypothetical protein ACKO9B_06050, partial [Planctomycetota bacterium]